MNKRQIKKVRKKVTYPLVDEMNLLTLSQEEYEKAMEDFHKYVQKHCRYKHYKDKWKACKNPFSYHFPVGEEYRKKINEKIEMFRGHEIDTIIVLQSIEQLKKMYNSNSITEQFTKVFKEEE